MTIIQSILQALARFLRSWYQFIISRKSNASKAVALLGSLFVVCCGLSVIAAPFTGANRGAASSETSTATSAAASSATEKPQPTAIPPTVAQAEVPTVADLPTTLPASPTEQATLVPPLAAVPTLIPTLIPTPRPIVSEKAPAKPTTLSTPVPLPPTATPPDNAQPSTSPDNGVSINPATGQPFACNGGCATPPDPSCAIKGNVNSKGEKIYHMPGMRDYNRTDIKPAEGDGWFCTEAEAQEAGFRRAQR